MKKNNKDSFLNSLVKVKPLKKSNRLSSPTPKIKQTEIRFVRDKISNETQVTRKKNDNKNYNELSPSFNNNRNLRRGKIPIQKKIDFHGYSLSDAYEIFLETIHSCYNSNTRCILFVTGKGLINKDKEEYSETKLYYGKIRNNFLP